MIISKTPLRASLFGGGTDFKQYFTKGKYGYGSVISTAIGMHVYITVNKRFDDMLRIVYMGNELVSNVDEIKHNIIREALKIVGIEKGIEIIYTADIPLSGAGIGLASSSALAVGVLNALYAYKGKYVSPELLARQACEIEINRLGQQIGIQDQFAVAMGGFNRYKFFPNGDVQRIPILCNELVKQTLQNRLMLFYTGSMRDSRAIFKEQNETMNAKRQMLDGLVEITENIQAKAFVMDELDMIGQMLDTTWKIKKKFATGVTNEIIDRMYETTMDSGALGGKILGAGGGGFLLTYVHEDKQTKVREAMRQYKEVPFLFEPMGSHIIFAD